MPGVDAFPAAMGAALPCVLLAGLFAYGPAPGLELIPYFLGLLAWVGMAVLAVLWTPIAALWRRLRGKRGPAAAAPESDALPTSTPTTQGDGSQGPA